MGAKPFHFLLIGALLYLVQGWLPAPQAVIKPPGEARIKSIENQWLLTNSRSPTSEELSHLIQRELDNDILFQEALARRWHEKDDVVQKRLLLNMKFLSQGTEEASEGDLSLLQEALRLQMHLSDPVVKRRLAQLMEFSLQEDAGKADIKEAELLAYFKASSDQFTLPARFRVSHVFFSASLASKDEEGLKEKARSVHKELATKNASPEDASQYSDPFISGNHFNWMTIPQLSTVFGDGVASKLNNLPVGSWSEPVVSVFGIHLFWVHARKEARLEDPQDSLVQEKIRSGVIQQRGRELLTEKMIELREKYDLQSFYESRESKGAD